jgi:hypothetical protein
MKKPPEGGDGTICVVSNFKDHPQTKGIYPMTQMNQPAGKNVNDASSRISAVVRILEQYQSRSPSKKRI